jgi:arylsulfatase A-like enzyme
VTRPSAAAWLVAAAIVALAVAREDALIALGTERITVPLVAVAAVAVVAVVWNAVVAAFLVERPGAIPIVGGLPALPLAIAAASIGAEAAVPATPGAGGAGPDVILVTLDTFRADRLGAIGGGSLTPALDALAAQGVVYTQAFAAVPLTAPSHASLLTGEEPLAHGLVRNGGAVLAHTVVPAIAARGYATGAFVSSTVLDRTTGLEAGFCHYDDRFGLLERLGSGASTQRRGALTVDRAVDWLERQDRPAFLWVHVYDPHLPYDPPAEFRPSDAELAAARADDADERRQIGDGRVAGAERAHVREGILLYDGEIRAADAAIGRLLAAVPADAVVIAVADHGESLDDNGYLFDHGALLHDPAIHVPLIVRWPGVIAPGRDDRLVATTSVAATLLDAAGVEASPASLRADPTIAAVRAWTPGQQNRLPLARGPWHQDPGNHRASAAIRVVGGKALSQNGGSAVWLDLVADPGESAPVALPPDRLALGAEVEAMSARAVAADPAAGLRALGYVE